MPFELNEAPQLLLKTFLHYCPELKANIEVIFKKDELPDYPSNVLVIQDSNPYGFALNLKKLLLNEQELNSTDAQQLTTLITWQARQVYRIINAAISSSHIDSKLQVALLQLREELEQSEEVGSLLKDIELNKIKPELVCSGHGSANIGAGYVKNIATHNVEIVLHAGAGSTITDSYGLLIENQLYHQYQIKIFNRHNKEKTEDVVFPKVITRDSMEVIANYMLEADPIYNLKARVIEFETGRILFETIDKISLEEIIKLFPGHRIHWGACNEIKADNDPTFHYGPFKNHIWYAHTKKRDFKRSVLYHRPYKPAHFFKDKGTTSQSTNDSYLPPKKRYFSSN